MEASLNSAIRRGFFQQVRYLIQFGQNVNVKDDERRTPLMNCAFIEDVKWGVGLARLLIEKKAVMTSRDKRGMNALHYACIYDRKGLVQVLLQSPDFDINQGDLTGNTSLHYAVTKGNASITRLLVRAITKYALKVDKANRKGITPLMLAWKSGQEECALVLLEEGNADQTLCDLVENKSAKDFEEDFRQQKIQRQSELQNTRPRLYGRSLPRYTRPTSAVTTSSYTSVFSGGNRARGMRARPKSAILLGRRRQSNTADPDEEEPNFLADLEKEKRSGKVFRSASCSDLRNKPEYITNISPIECFANEGQYQATQPSPHDTGASDNQHSPSASWKTEMKDMYSFCGFQFSGAYRSGAKPQDTGYIHDGDDRACSPFPSDCDSLRDHNSLERLAKKTGKKIAVKNALTQMADSKLQRKVPGKSLSRKISTSSTNSLKTQQSNLDTSSSESVNSSMRNGKKRNSPASSDFRDDVSDVSSQDKSTKGRTRKISATSMEDHSTNTDTSLRGSSRGVSIPTVKEPLGQEHLGSIRE